MFARLPLLSKIAGVILIIFGLHTMGVFRTGQLTIITRYLQPYLPTF